jgi:hypothetical protein
MPTFGRKVFLHYLFTHTQSYPLFSDVFRLQMEFQDKLLRL